MNKDYVAPWVRVAILILSSISIMALSYFFTGSVIPSDPGDALIFQNALLLIVIGVALLEKYYTKPADSMVNSLMGIVTLIGVYNIAPRLSWWVVTGYVLLVFLFSIITTLIYSLDVKSPRLGKLADFTYKPAVLFGQAKVIYSIIFLFALFAFRGIQSLQTVALVLFWGIFIVIWPLGIPQFFSKMTIRNVRHKPVGHVARTDWPNIVRSNITPDTEWKSSSIKVFQQAGGQQSLVLPLFYEPQGEELVGTGLIVKNHSQRISYLEDGFLYDLEGDALINDSEVSEALGGGATSKLVGFVVEDSIIPEIKFEIWDSNVCWEGMLVWCFIGSKRVYYQVTSGATREETFQSNRHGFQLGTASQLGVIDEKDGFLKHNWVPRMNTPVFAESESFGENINLAQPHDFVYGKLPGTKLNVAGPFLKYMDHHTAILGVTGSGKTELAFDLIRHALQEGMKVICIDLTARYEKRLIDLSPVNLSLTPQNTKALNDKLFDVETGEFGAKKEKKALEEFSQKIRQDVQASIEAFLAATEKEKQLGVIALEEISNTKATLYITEVYLTCLLNFARNNPQKSPKVLIVVEEAHTVMPEPSTMGLGDNDSRGLVGKIAQLALQGRKYGVGLLVIAQRTATVSKSILTQCNTVISFNCFDDTSLNFLSNVFGASHVALIPNLARLNAVIFGKGLRSQRPLLIEIQYDPKKAEITP